jgi:WD40 repeat protein
VAFNPSGTEVAVGYADGEIAVFSARTGKKMVSASDGSGIVYDIAFVGNTGEIAIASQQNAALWQFTKGSHCCELLSGGQATTIASAPGNPQELAVATASGVGIVNVSGQGHSSRHLTSTPASSAALNYNGSEVVTAETTGDIGIYDVATGKAIARLLGDSAPTTVAFNRDGNRVVAGYASGTATVWDVASKLPLTQLAGNAGEVSTATFSADGSEVVTAGADGTVRVWYAQPRELRTEFTSPPDSDTPDPVAGADYVGSRIVSFDESHHVYVFTAGGAPQADITPAGMEVDAADWDHSGSKIVMASANGVVQIWQATGSTYAPVPVPIDTGQNTYSVAINPDGSRIAIVTNGYTVQVRSAETGGVQQTLSAHSAIEGLDMNASGQVIGADYHGQVEMWNGGSTSPRMLGAAGPGLVYIAFSKSGTEFVTVSTSGAVTVWDTRTARIVQSIDNACPAPSSANFNPAGSMIVVSCDDGTIRVFDVASGQPLVVLQATSVGVVQYADFSPDGNSIVAAINAGNTGCVQVWNAELATTSLKKLRQIASQRVTQQLTPAQRQEYLPSGV